jgi:hypothetical protein
VTNDAYSTLLKVCLAHLDDKAKSLSKMLDEQRNVSFPGGFPKTFVNDLGVVALTGLLLLHAWLFFAVRRENHSIASFVDMDRHTQSIGRVFPKTFDLIPRYRFLSPEHLAYAYHSISQRFVFIFSTHSRPLLLATSLLLWCPSLVALWNLITDVRDVILKAEELQPVSVHLKMLVETALVVMDLVISWFTWRFTMRSSMLLNGWNLACNEVWIHDWDERDPEDVAATVRVDVNAQRAFRLPAPSEPSSISESG